MPLSLSPPRGKIRPEKGGDDMSDNDKNIAKEILLFLIDRQIGECRNLPQENTVETVGKLYKTILSYVPGANAD